MPTKSSAMSIDPPPPLPPPPVAAALNNEMIFGNNLNPHSPHCGISAPTLESDIAYQVGDVHPAANHHHPANRNNTTGINNINRLPSSTKKRKRPTEPLPQGIPFNASDHPELQLDPTIDTSKFVHAFKQPIFKEPSKVLSIAYSHHRAATKERTRIRAKKKATLTELQELRQEFMNKKQELLNMNTQLKASSKKVAMWTSKVFDLELKEPNCLWNEKLARLRQYKELHGTIPEYNKKNIVGGGDEKVLAQFLSTERTNYNKISTSSSSIISKYPHRRQALEDLGVDFEFQSDAKFRIMFAKLLAYKREHGTFRMPSISICKESGNIELIKLHNWLYGIVANYRHRLQYQKYENVKQFIDAGFSFEQWYATNGHVFSRDNPPFDAIAKRYVDNDGVMDEKDVEILRKAAAANSPGKKRGPYKKKKKSGGKMGTDDEAGLLVVDEVGAGDTADAGASFTAAPNTATLGGEELKVKDRNTEEEVAV